jgi:hypothetical protein
MWERPAWLALPLVCSTEHLGALLARGYPHDHNPHDTALQRGHAVVLKLEHNRDDGQTRRLRVSAPHTLLSHQVIKRSMSANIPTSVQRPQTHNSGAGRWSPAPPPMSSLRPGSGPCGSGNGVEGKLGSDMVRLPCHESPQFVSQSTRCWRRDDGRVYRKSSGGCLFGNSTA